MHLKKLDDPLALFAQWFAKAREDEPDFPDGAALSTVNEDGYPTARMVLIKAFDEDGFVFYTNLGSAKSHQLRALPKAGLCFHWKSLHKQVRIEGDVAQVDDDVADAYFASRPRVSQLGAWASRQSQPLAGRFELEARVAKMTAKFGAGEIPRPQFWSGFRLRPVRIEFWDQRPYRLHDRLEYRRDASGWTTRYLYP
jgi:pyridoxamine 5'-phosphate oxidase